MSCQLTYYTANKTFIKSMIADFPYLATWPDLATLAKCLYKSFGIFDALFSIQQIVFTSLLAFLMLYLVFSKIKNPILHYFIIVNSQMKK